MKRFAIVSALFGALVFPSAPVYAANTAPVIVELAKRAGISEELARKEFDLVINSIKAELLAGRDVTVTNFGKFYVQERAARTGRNPRTGAALEIPAKRYARFTSADGLKNEMNPQQTANVEAKPVPKA